LAIGDRQSALGNPSIGNRQSAIANWAARHPGCSAKVPEIRAVSFASPACAAI
jgi:hypothetical protein